MATRSTRNEPDRAELSVEELEARIVSADSTDERHQATVALMRRILYTDSLRVTDLGREILDEVRSGADTLLHAHLLEYLGVAAAHQHYYDEATDHFTQARPLFAELQDRLHVNLMTTNLGNVETFRGNFDKALEHYSTSLDMTIETGNDRHRVTVLGNIALLHIHRNNLAEAESYLSEGLELAEVVGHELGMASLLHNRGVLRYERGSLREGLIDLYRSLEIYRRLERRAEVANVSGSIAVSLFEAGDFEEALNQYRLALDESRAIGDTRGTAQHLSNLGILYRELQRFEEALDYFRESLSIQESLGNSYKIAIPLINVGDLCTDLGEWEEALGHYQRTIDLALEADDRRSRAYALLGIARVRREKGEMLQAHTAVDEALRIFRGLDLPRDIVTALIERGKIAQQVGRIDESLQLFEEARLTADRHQLDREKIDLYSELSRACEAAGDYRAALEHHREFQALRDRRRDEEAERRYIRLSVIHEVDRQKQMRQVAEKEAEILRLEKERLEAEGEHRQKELITTAMFLTQKSDLLRRLRYEIGDLRREAPAAMKNEFTHLLSSIDSSIDMQESWQLFEDQFRLVHADFTETLAARSPDLSPTELKVCALVKIGLTTKEVARILNIEPRSVETYRGRIRKKLGLGVGDNLQMYLTGM